MQSTLQMPAVTNMRKALYLQYTAGLLFYYGVSIAGYWAYGATVYEYLPQELSGPKSVKVLINAAVFLQSIVSQHVRMDGLSVCSDILDFTAKGLVFLLNNFKF